MSENEQVPEPVLFNCLKHHLEYIRHFIAISATQDISFLSKNLNIIGESQMDLYIGNLSPAEISFEIVKQLEERQLLKKEAFISWLLSQQSGYARLQVSDFSTWILRRGSNRNAIFIYIPEDMRPIHYVSRLMR